jgi:uncharacterized protein YbaR (Trm112 family)
MANSETHSTSSFDEAQDKSGQAKICQNCKQAFTIEPDDFSFYEKLKVPPPTFCPQCRKQRRLSWRNDINLYSRKCDLCKKSIISLYSTDKPFPVYCQKCWWGDGWDPKQYAQEYDFAKPFFMQFKEFHNRVPALAMVNDDGIASVNCEYTQDFSFAKNCYMCFIGWKVEDCMYDHYLIDGKAIVDSLSSIGECEYLYDTIQTQKCYQCRNVYDSISLSDCSFCYDCRDCTDCFMSVGLRHKRYCFKNEQYTKEEYEKILREYKLNTWAGVMRAKKEFEPMLYKYPRRFAIMRNCVNCTGDALINGKNSKHCFNVQRPEDSKWIENSDTPKDCYDLSVGGELNQCYEGITPDHSYHSFFSIYSWKNSEVAYVDGCHSSENLFGCAGLKKAKYCILNKEYSKEEYEDIIPKIKKHMSDMPYKDKQGNVYAFGEFFPSELSPFGYNESVAQDHFPLAKEDALQHGFSWQDIFQRTTGKETKKLEDLPESITDVSDTIVNEVLGCEKCNRNYRITPAELTFLKRMKIPIPHYCFYCRLEERFKFRNPYQLWHRTCDCSGRSLKNGVYANTATVHQSHSFDKTCPNEFETTYAPDRKEIVYCEQCYQAEVV